MSNKKPMGVVLIAIYSGFWGTVLLPSGCVASMASSVPGVPAYAGLLGMLLLALGVGMLAGTYGLWTIQPWGRTYNIWLELASVPFSLLTLVGFSPAGKVTAVDRITSIIGLVITVVIVKYLSSDHVKQLFGEAPLGNWQRSDPRM